MHDLLVHLQSLEAELHHPDVRCSRQRLEELLHQEFHEVGRSGRQYSRETVIRYLAAEETQLTAIAEDPDGRFQSAPALAAELAKIQQRHPLDDATREAATTVRPPRQNRGTRLPAHPYGPPARSILPRLLALGAVIALLLVLWALLNRQGEPRIARSAIKRSKNRGSRGVRRPPSSTRRLSPRHVRPAIVPPANRAHRSAPGPL